MTTYRFYKDSLTDNADLAGRWEMTLTSDGKNTAGGRDLSATTRSHHRHGA